MKKLIHVVMVAAAFIAGGFTAVKFKKKDSKGEEQCWKERADKFKTYYGVTTEWIQTLHNGGRIADYFEKNKYKRVVIYGKGLLGELLSEELSKCKSVEIVCFVDKQTDEDIQCDAETPVIHMKDLKKLQYDIIVVTPVFAFAEIRQMLLETEEARKIVSLQDVIVDCR